MSDLKKAFNFLTLGGKGLFLSGSLPGLPLNQVPELLSKPRLASALVDAESRVESRPKRKRCTLNKAEELSLEHHRLVRPTILSVYHEIRTLLCECHVESDNVFRGDLEDGKPAPIHLSTVCNISELVPKSSGSCVGIELSSVPVNHAHCGDLADCLLSNSGDHSVTLEHKGNRYHIPRKCNLLMSDVSHLCPLVDSCSEHSKRFNIVVMDPPWSNKSAFRSKSYSSLPFGQICNIPVPKLLAPGALVIVWATNDRKVVNYIRNVMFPEWSVEYVTEWSWLKVASSGEMVSDLDSFHCKPYESLVVGIFANDYQCQPESVLKGPSGVDLSRTAIFNVPPEFVLCSVPSVIHSQKPSLTPVIRHCLTGKTELADLKCLELFARNLTPGWTSWGNEVLKFQQL